MCMSSYEVVRRAIEFDCPDRLPVANPRPANSPNGVGGDVHTVHPGQIGVGDKAKRQSRDEWGATWVRSSVHNGGQIKGHPLASWDALGGYDWPSPDDPILYAGMESQLSESAGRYVMVAFHFLFFERLQALRGTENVLIDLLAERQRIAELADRVVAYDLAVIRNISQRFPGQIHGFFFTDDWGTQRATFISPELWRDFFKPRYARIFQAIHDAGWHVWMHSCGKVNELLDDLIDIDLDVINLDQPLVLGIEEIGDRFAGRLCFSSLCDIQRTLPRGNAEDIRHEAQLLLEHWATDGGGFILTNIGYASEEIGSVDENSRMMIDAFQAVDPWKEKAFANG